MNIDLEGRVVLVTGASRGIGAAAAAALAAAGARVAVHYATSADRAKALADRIPGDARAFRADLSDPASAAGLIEGVRSHYGGIDALVNNAGIALAAPLDMELDPWIAAMRRTLDVNLVAAAALTKLVIPQLRAQGGGRIVYVASRAAFRGDTPEYLAYAASKGGMVALAKSVARGFGKDRIAAFVVAPGFVRTDMAQAFIEAYGEGIAVDDLAWPELTQPADLAPLIVLLVSGLADHATGTSIDVNAGSYVH